MPDDHINSFREAEQQAHDLVQVLEDLKVEVGSYRDASQSLDNAGSRLAEASDRISQLVGRAGEALESLRTLGTAQLMAQLDVLATGINHQGQVAEERHQKSVADTNARLEQVMKGVTDLRGSNGRLEQLAAGHHSDIRTTLDAIGALTTRLETVDTTTKSALSTLRLFAVLNMVLVIGLGLFLIMR